MLGCDYGTASRAWYYLGIQTYVLDKFKYANSYQYWNGNLNMPIKEAIFICDVNDSKNIEILHQYFNKVVKNGRIYFFQTCQSWKIKCY